MRVIAVGAAIAAVALLAGARLTERGEEVAAPQALSVAQSPESASPVEAGSCGDGQCQPPEDCHTCPQDCGGCCGNRRCEPPEDCRSCPEDCGPCS